MKAVLFVGAAGIPDGFKLCKYEAIRHPTDGMFGALIMALNTGLFFHLSAGVIRTIDQRKARRIIDGTA